MRFLRRRPAKWSDGLTRDAANEIKNALLASLSDGEGVDWDSWPEGAIVQREDGFEIRYALARLAELYRTTDGDRQALLHDHFAAMGLILEEPPEDWATARAMLRAKIYSDLSFDEAAAGDFILLRIAPDLVAMLQLELPGSFRGVTRVTAAAWGVSDADLWDTARQNVHEHVPLTDERITVNDGCELRVLHNQHRLVTSHLLELPNHLDATAEGAIIGIPHENLMHLHEVRDRSADGALGYILAATPEMFQESPTTGISPHAYWWRDGTLTRLTDSDGKYLRYSPPAEFDTIMRRLVGQA